MNSLVLVENAIREENFKLLDKVPLNFTLDNNGDTVLHFSIACGKERAAAFFIRSGHDVNARNGNGESPLHYAAATNLVSTTALLIHLGAYLDAKDSLGETPLHHAVRNNQLYQIMLLAKAGANVNARDEDGETPLYLAHTTNLSKVRLLLSRLGASTADLPKSALSAGGGTMEAKPSGSKSFPMTPVSEELMPSPMQLA